MQPKEKPTTVCFDAAKKATEARKIRGEPVQAKVKPNSKPYCPSCDTPDRYLSSHKKFLKPNINQSVEVASGFGNVATVTLWLVHSYVPL